MSEPSLDLSRLKAVIFDLDGTLYRQGPLRRAMALRLLRAHVFHPSSGFRTMRTIAAYRSAQETLRGAPDVGDLAEMQLSMAADRSGVNRDTVAADVERWVEQAPIDLLLGYVQPGLVDLLEALRCRGLKLAVLSDYQPVLKLRALGILHFFDVVLCAQDREIGVFKPHPRGLQVALGRLDVSASEALYVGDRAEVDAAGAAAAGVTCAILTRSANRPGKGIVQIRGFGELQSRLVPA